jgi:hypothetical protein
MEMRACAMAWFIHNGAARGLLDALARQINIRDFT